MRQGGARLEHRDAIAHVLEGDAQFFLALADFVQQPRVLHRDYRLGGEVLQQRDLLVGEGSNLILSINSDRAEKRGIFAQRNV